MDKKWTICCLVRGFHFWRSEVQLNTGTNWERKLIEKKLKRLGYSYDIDQLIQRIKSYSNKKLTQELRKYLPLADRKMASKVKDFLLAELIDF